MQKPVMKTQLLRDELPILVSMVADEQIQKVELSLHPQGFACQILGNPPPSLQKKIFQVLDAYISKKQDAISLLEGRNIPIFTHKVLQHLTTIAFGTTLTYKQIARAIASPQACRAVGNACGKNPFPLLIPCHRVLATKGLGGYSEGLHIKKILLQHEGISDIACN